MTVRPSTTPLRQLEGFLRKFAPDVRKTATAALKTLRTLVPNATELVYDKTNVLVVGFAPGDRPSEAILSIALYRKWVNLYFLDGAILKDPDGVLKGSGSRVRMLRLDSAALLDTPAVRALIAQAIDSADVPFSGTRKRRIIVRQTTTKRRH